MKIKVPVEWKDISLKKFIDYKDTVQEVRNKPLKAVMTVSLLCDKSIDEVKRIPIAKTIEIQNKIMDLIEKPVNMEPKQSIDVDGVKYVLNLNMDNMSTGEWVDIESLYESNSKNPYRVLPSLLSIIYRPIEGKKGKMIPYDGVLRPEIFNKLDMETVGAADFFFTKLGLRLKATSLYSIPKELKITKVKKKLTLKKKIRMIIQQIGVILSFAWRKIRYTG